MEKIVYFDYCAFVIVCILIISTVSRKMTYGKRNRYFMNLMAVMLVTIVADVSAINLDRMGGDYAIAKHIAHTAYLFLHTSTTPFYIAYLFTLTDIWHHFHKHRFAVALAFTPYLICAILILSTPFTGIVYYLDESYTYTRGPLFFTLYITAFFYSALGMVHLIKRRRQFTKHQFNALAAVIPVSLLAALIQLFAPGYILEMFANACSIIFVSMMVQRPEVLIDADTGLGKLSAYVENVHNARLNSKPMEIVMMNVVNYSILYDMLGYQQMNSMLLEIAEQLIALNKKKNLGAELYYLGHGKFRIVIDSDHFSMTDEIASLVCAAMHSDFDLNGMAVNTVSNVCVTRFPEDIDNVDSLLAFGNDLNTIPYTGEVMYASKVYRKQYYDIKKDIDLIIEEALAQGKFEVYYQPIYSVKEKRFNSAEALLRLKNEKYGFISPELLIPAAERSGAIHKIGAFVVEEVCRLISSKQYEDLGIDYIEINLSVAQCMQADLAENILATLEKYSVRPDQINLEITETAASYSQNTMMENLEALKNAGISFSLDDFGTGYSNMRRIASLPLHIVKLDKSFTNIEDNSNMQIVLENTIRMIKDMKMKIVVEGIETEKMVQQFSDLHCEYIQGYYYSKPLPKQDFIDFIKKAKSM